MTTSCSTPAARLGPVAWLRSFPAATRLLLGRKVRLRHDHVGIGLTMSDGRTFVPFRETTVRTPRSATVVPTVLQPRFRLRGVGDRPGRPAPPVVPTGAAS